MGPSHYYINVSLHGTHLFATAEHSLTSELELQELLDLFREKFPAAAGYKCDPFHYKASSHSMDD